MQLTLQKKNSFDCFLYSILLLLFLQHSSYAQQSAEVESLLQQVKESTSTEKQTDLYNKIAFRTNASDPVFSIQHARKALAIAIQSGYAEGEATAYARIGLALGNQMEHDSALWYYDHSLKIVEDINYLSGIARAKNGIGLVYKNQKLYSKSIPLFSESLELYKQLENWGAVRVVNFNLCEAYVAIEEYQKAIQTTQEELEIHKGNDNNYLLAAINLDLSYYYIKNQNYNKAIQYSSESLELSKKINNEAFIFNSYNNIGLAYLLLNQLDSAKYFLDRGLKISKKINSDNFSFEILRNFGLLYTQLNNFEEAIKTFDKAIAINKKNKNNISIIGNYYLKSGNYINAINIFLKLLKYYENKNTPYLLSEINLNLSFFYSEARNYQKSIKYGLESIKHCEQIDNNLYKARNYLNIGGAYFKLDNFRKAEEYYRKGLKISKNYSFFNESALFYINLGELYIKQKTFDQALEYFDLCLKLYPSKQNSCLSFLNKGVIYHRKNQLNKAQNLYKQALTISEEIKHARLKMSILKSLSSLHAEKKEYQLAANYRKQYISLSDSIYSSFQGALNYKDALEIEQNERKILQKDKEIQQAKILQFEAEASQQRTLIYALSAGIVLILALYYVSLKSSKHKRRVLIAEKSVILKQQEVEDLLRKQEVETFSALLEGQETERRRIAQDLHDRLGSMLAMVKLHFSAVNDVIEHIQLNTINQYVRASALLDEACEEVRQVAHNMVSGTLSKFGLWAALENLKQGIESTNLIEIELVGTGLEGSRLETKVEVTVYRIIQELISNTLKHAEASDLSIQLFKKEDLLNIIVEDNGKGFDTKDNDYQEGMGTKNIQARVHSLQGNLKIDTKKQRGTTVILDVPL